MDDDHVPNPWIGCFVSIVAAGASSCNRYEIPTTLDDAPSDENELRRSDDDDVVERLRSLTTSLISSLIEEILLVILSMT